MIAIIEGKHILGPENFHDAMASALGFPEYYGRNLDALRDCLTGWVTTPLTIIWKDYSVSRNALGVFAERAVSVIREAASEVDGLELRLE